MKFVWSQVQWPLRYWGFVIKGYGFFGYITDENSYRERHNIYPREIL